MWVDFPYIRFPLEASATALDNFGIGSKVEVKEPVFADT